jgi:8-oxo-dGTP pyrophosphatase MutT (NUDIX family)
VIAIGAEAPHPVIFIERSAHLRHHPGQIAFPGGGIDPADQGDIARTALRELAEETAIAPERVRLVGRLDDVRGRVNPFIITPFVGIVAPGPPPVPDGGETIAVFTPPLAALLAPGAVHQGTERLGAYGIETWIFDWEGMHVWGVTGRILATFVETVRAGGALRTALEETGVYGSST